MNLNYTVKTIAQIISADVKNSSNLQIDELVIKNVVIDTRNPAINSNTLFIAIPGIKVDGHQFLKNFSAFGGQVAIVNKFDSTINLCQLVVKNSVIALQALASFHRKQYAIETIAITGSNGKTIVKEWLYQSLKNHFNIVRSPKSYNSQIGVALSVLEINEKHNLAIFEAGISKPGEMQKLADIIQPTIGVFTGIGDAHSANFNSMEEKKDEKFKLFRSTKRLFEFDESINFDNPFSDIASQKNVNLVYQVCQFLGVKTIEIENTIKELGVVAMRLQQVQGKNNCLILNDSYNADFDSLVIALQQFDTIHNKKNKVIIMSSFEDSKTDIRKITEILNNSKADQIIFIGDNIQATNLKIPAEKYTDVNQFLKDNIQFENATILVKGSRSFKLERIVQRLSEKKHVTKLFINLSAMRNNLNYFKNEIAAGTKILAMVKAQSYGGGLKEIATFLVKEGVDYFGVAYADEGVILREAGIQNPIIVMNPEESSFDELTQYKLEPSIYSPELLDAFINHLILNETQQYPIHLKLDTGMNRLGFLENQLRDLINTLLTQPEVYVKSVYSHLSSADIIAENDYTSNQIRKFEMMLGQLMYALPYTFDKHLANSAGAANFKRASYDMVRLGIGLYGLLGRKYQSLENVLTLTTQISQIKRVDKGESVGYGRSFIATHNQLIGIIPVGYADGLRRGLSQGNWSVLVNGKKAPIVGNICMDMCMISLEGIDAKIGDEVEVFGNNVTIYDMAENLKTIPYEIIAGISSRVHRVYLED